ncbi:glycosyltransferase [Nocardioides marmoriginsengisoli]|uniref:Glycosyltransferase n=1 Tax=Nocardioides marmoriginsengisoli TaxID=661483 RepID=A0A3N0CLS8_9ACTN|nr:glycosyltransferase family 2 protein [Nocardioides marmoriginsengisoli]RNL64427.1 glycosyltransferase [Nocardioides marmoriginsengisoli]
MLPFYGDAALLRQAVESVLAQSDPRWRLHVVDDCYPDPGAAAWVAAIADPRVTFERNERNLGVSANFARCLATATADHVVFLGCDDVMAPTYVADVSAAIETHPQAAVITPRVRVIDRDGAPARTPADRVKAVLTPRRSPDGSAVVLGGEALAGSLMHGDWLYFPAITWRRELIAAASFRTDMETVLDLALLMDLVLDGHRFVLLDTASFSYRRHGESASSVSARTTRRFDEEAQLFSEVATACLRRGWTRAARAARLHATSRIHAAVLVPAALRSRDRTAAGALIRHATRSASR